MPRSVTLRPYALAVLALAPVAAALGYEGGRIAEYRHAVAAAEDAGAALDGALGACRARSAGTGSPEAGRETIGLTPG